MFIQVRTRKINERDNESNASRQDLDTKDSVLEGLFYVGLGLVGSPDAHTKITGVKMRSTSLVPKSMDIFASALPEEEAVM